VIYRTLFRSRTFYTSLAGIVGSLGGVAGAYAALQAIDPGKRDFWLAVAAFCVAAASGISNVGSILAREGGVESARQVAEQVGVETKAL
jgi:hypothetical protein